MTDHALITWLSCTDHELGVEGVSTANIKADIISAILNR